MFETRLLHTMYVYYVFKLGGSYDEFLKFNTILNEFHVSKNPRTSDNNRNGSRFVR